MRDRGQEAALGDERTVTDLLIDQVEFCDVRVLNKTDLVTPADLERTESVLHHLNPGAEIVRAERARVPLGRVLETGRFDMEKAKRSAGWLRELEGEHVPETEQYGISSFVYRARRPFDPAPLWRLLHSARHWETVLRSKGFFWIATRPGVCWSWSLAGRRPHVEAMAPFWADQWPTGERPEGASEERWDPRWGDRMQELVLIGIGMDQADLRRRLDACLVDEALSRSGPASWSLLDDPFPPLPDGFWE